MESDKNDVNNGEDGHQHQQLRGNARKRTFNELANDEDKPADEDQQQKPENCSKKNRDGQRGNGALENLDLESLTREELIQLVQKQLIEKNEAQKRLVTMAEEKAKQAEEFSQRNIQLEQEKAEVQEDLHQKMGEIVKMHKEVEEKSKEIVEKAKQIDALLIQLKESTSHEHQIGLPTEQQEQMKLQLSLETWYDWLAFVPRHQLGQIVPQIGDRKFVSIVQKFLHDYGESSIDRIQIVAPYPEDPSGCPRVRARQLRFEMAEAQMPANIKNFRFFELSYFDNSVLNFIQKFQQNGLLDNVSLLFAKLPAQEIVQPVLCHLLPLLNRIESIYVEDSDQLVDFYNAENSKEIYEMNMKMLEKTRFLGVSDDRKNLHPNKIDLYCRWLYQPTRADGKSLVLVILYCGMNLDYSPISLFINRLKQDFLMATNPAIFIIRIALPKAFQPLEAICLDNDKTKERFQTKMENANPKWDRLQISRHPLASTNKWIVGKEYDEKRIYLSKELKVVAI